MEHGHAVPGWLPGHHVLPPGRTVSGRRGNLQPQGSNKCEPAGRVVHLRLDRRVFARVAPQGHDD